MAYFAPDNRVQTEDDRDARQDADTTYYTCTVSVILHTSDVATGTVLGEASLHSIGELDGYSNAATSYRAEVVNDLWTEAQEVARDVLNALRSVSL